MDIIERSDVPQNSLVYKVFPDTHYSDSFRLYAPNNCSVETFTKAFLVSNPSWVHKLMSVRNTIVKLCGLKTSPMPKHLKSNIEVGKQLGIFKVYSVSTNEIILGEDDKHLNFRVSIYKEPSNQWINVSTVVHFNNMFGRAYFLPVKPFHGLIIPASLRETVKKLS